MSFGFHTSTSLKENRALLKKRKSYKDIRTEYEGYLPNAKLQFKELTEFEKKKIRDKIIERAKRNQSNEILIYIASFIVVLPLILIFIWVFLNYLL